MVVEADGQPDYLTAYFDTSNPCYENSFPDGRNKNPNVLGEQSIAMSAPSSPSGGGGAMALGTVGVSVNGVSIYNNAAAPGDNIYDEVQTFDRCEGHPAGTSYHYHTEPPSISSSDNHFIGVMRDGNPVYGRFDDSTTLESALDGNGGHTHITEDSDGVAVYHYHVNLQTDGTDSAYFITSGTYNNTAGPCTGCN